MSTLEPTYTARVFVYKVSTCTRMRSAIWTREHVRKAIAGGYFRSLFLLQLLSDTLQSVRVNT